MMRVGVGQNDAVRDVDLETQVDGSWSFGNRAWLSLGSVSRRVPADPVLRTYWSLSCG